MSLAFSGVPAFYAQGSREADGFARPGDPPDCPKPSASYVKQLQADPGFAGAGAEMLSDGTTLDSQSAMPRSSFPGVMWAEDWNCFFGKVTTICMGAWCVFITVPLLFFLFVSAAANRLSNE